MIFAEHPAIGRREGRLLGREMLEPPEMRRAPVGAFAEDEAAAREDLALERFAAADDIAHALLGLAGDADGGQLAAPIKASQLGGVVLVVLPLNAGPFGDKRWRDDIAGIAPLAHRAVQHIAGAAGLVA